MDQNNRRKNVRVENRVINSAAAQNKQVQSYIKLEIERARKEMDKISKEIAEFE